MNRIAILICIIVLKILCISPRPYGLETRVIIKISTHPCQTNDCSQFSSYGLHSGLAFYRYVQCIDENVNNLMTVASLVFMRSCHYFAANELRKQMGGFIYTFSHFLVDFYSSKLTSSSTCNSNDNFNDWILSV